MSEEKVELVRVGYERYTTTGELGQAYTRRYSGNKLGSILLTVQFITWSHG